MLKDYDKDALDIRSVARTTVIGVACAIALYVLSISAILPTIAPTNTHALGTHHYYYRHPDISAHLDAMLDATFHVHTGDATSYSVLVNNQKLVIDVAPKYELQFVYRKKSGSTYVFLRSYPFYGPWHRLYRSGDYNRIDPELYSLYDLPKKYQALE